ncbi:ATP-binding protein [Pararhizobium sp. DWP1-1-3]|uniref:ATP-binding protein n=1 Tax=Pararhizobium sp. DWP1-1-3 TaxID=2804652 RepID=UPI003CFB776B
MTPARILVVEDDRVVSRDIQLKLCRIGHAVAGHTARGEDAVSLAIETRADLVLMDIRLEGAIDGVEAARQIRDVCRLPVIFLTAYADDETVKRASLTEPFGYLLKPFDDSQLRTVVEMAVYKHGAERRLRESERRYATTLSSIGDAVIATDESSIITFMNPSSELLTGWPSLQGVGRPLDEVFRVTSATTRRPVKEPVAEFMSFGADAGFARQTILVTKDGREIPIEDSGSPIIGDTGELTGAVVVFRDVSERNRAQERLRKAHQELAHVGRVATIGELTVSIAHEINQPLMAITTNAAACMTWLAGAQPNINEAKQVAERIIRDGHRAGEVVASIRALARKSDPTMSSVDLGSLILEVVLLLQGEMRRFAISAETQLSNTALRVRGDRVQLQQLVLNLLMNGMDAIIAAHNEPRLLRITTEENANDSITVTVSDTGVGLAEGTATKVFDAFFTTKPDGIGMGLSICRSIVEAHGGRLWCSNNRDMGSSFHFTVLKMAEATRA